jgi:hypothetical protein
MKSNPTFHLPMELSIITLCLAVGLPAYLFFFSPFSCIGLFPQMVKLNIKDLEPSFHDLKDKSGNKMKYIYFNKGL